MILQLNRFGFSGYPRRCRHMSDANSASLRAFQSLVSGKLNEAVESLKPGSRYVSLTWIHQCFELVGMINNAFAKLMVEIDYPVTSWEATSIDEYLDYTINLLDVLNSISCSISHINQARVSLTHALSLMETSPALATERMHEITTNHDHSIKQFKASDGTCDHVDRNHRNEKERIFHVAMMVVKTTGFWLCEVVLSGLTSVVDPIMDVRRNERSLDSSLLMAALDSILKKKLMEEGGVLKEVEGVNEMVRLIVSSGIDACDGGIVELKRRLEGVGSGLRVLKQEEECVFGAIMARRNEVLEILRKNETY